MTIKIEHQSVPFEDSDDLATVISNLHDIGICDGLPVELQGMAWAGYRALQQLRSRCRDLREGEVELPDEESESEVAESKKPGKPASSTTAAPRASAPDKGGHRHKFGTDNVCHVKIAGQECGQKRQRGRRGSQATQEEINHFHDAHVHPGRALCGASASSADQLRDLWMDVDCEGCKAESRRRTAAGGSCDELPPGERTPVDTRTVPIPAAVTRHLRNPGTAQGLTLSLCLAPLGPLDVTTKTKAEVNCIECNRRIEAAGGAL